MRCIEVKKDNPSTITNSIIGSFNYVIKGTPSNGPLFPAVPDQYIPTLSLILLQLKSDTTDEEIADFFISQGYKLLTSKLTSGELQTSITTIKDTDFFGTVMYRKNQTELYFKEEMEMESHNFSSVAYGYCYQLDNQ